MSGRSVNLTTLFLDRLRPPKRLTILRAHTFASNWQLPFLKKRKEKRKYVARPGIKPRTPDLRVSCPTDCATRPGSLIPKHGRQYIPCSTKFSMALQTEILSTEPSDFLNQITFSSNLIQCLNCFGYLLIGISESKMLSFLPRVLVKKNVWY